MVWFMIFCSMTAYSGATCMQPVRFKTREACEFVLNKQLAVARSIRDGKGICLGVKGA